MLQLDMEKPVKGKHVKELSNEDYHADKALSSSQLKQAKNNIELFKKSVIDKSISFKPTASMKTGTLFHELVLEPHNFKPLVYPNPKIDKRTRAYKSWVEDNAVQEGDEIITEGELRNLETMKANLYAHPECPDFSKTMNEHSYFYTWKDFDLRIRPDALDFDTDVIYDVKTMSGPLSKNDFFHHVNKYDYDLSAAMYVQAMAAHTGRPWSFCFVVCQTVEPFSTGLYWLGDSLFFQGFSKFRKALDNIKKARRLGTYRFQQESQVLETWRDVVKFDASGYYRARNSQNVRTSK